ncbi:hypothetical protein BDP27DRAFT_1416434 [Rhodocollybia butyracea]|uniref:Uncharacterized protein n=1 Tax=Rhodocollybia butyracea TaxID=206335 RepID=A0A9P5Q5T5_9AGAR|nr:hypothetical protein BDP27DRAFT_1416434 [Rhodocollybia butyracea]
MFSLRPLSAFILAVSTASVLAGTFVSPAASSTISSSAEFNFTWVSSRYFEESSQSVSVLLAPNANFPLEGIVLAKDLTPISSGVGESGPTYYAPLTPEFVASSSHTGDFVLVVVEDYTAYGGNAGMSVEYETITLN